MRKRAPFVNNEVYVIPHFLCVGRVSDNIYLWKLFYYDKTCICSKTIYFVLLTIFCTVCHAPSLTFSNLFHLS